MVFVLIRDNLLENRPVESKKRLQGPCQGNEDRCTGSTLDG